MEILASVVLRHVFPDQHGDLAGVLVFAVASHFKLISEKRKIVFLMTEAIFNLKDVVRIRKNDVKDKKKSEKFINIVRYAFQELVSEGTYAAELRQGKHSVIDLCKQEVFRNQFMLMVEA